MQVTKRDGSKEPQDIRKIQKVTEWACAGLNVSQSELEVEANLLFFDGIKTSQIHNALIGAAAAPVPEARLRHLVRFSQKGQFNLPPVRFTQVYAPQHQAQEQKPALGQVTVH